MKTSMLSITYFNLNRQKLTLSANVEIESFFPLIYNLILWLSVSIACIFAGKERLKSEGDYYLIAISKYEPI